MLGDAAAGLVGPAVTTGARVGSSAFTAVGHAVGGPTGAAITSVLGSAGVGMAETTVAAGRGTSFFEVVNIREI